MLYRTGTIEGTTFIYRRGLTVKGRERREGMSDEDGFYRPGEEVPSRAGHLSGRAASP